MKEMAVDPSTIEIGKIEEVDLRTVFGHEALTFTPWLARTDNLTRLGEAIGLRLELVDTEVNTGSFRVDIVARDIESDSLVIVENQFNRSDHDHLGKVLTYLAAKNKDGARTVVWLAEKFSEEHRAVLNWLNDVTGENAYFFGIVPKILKIGPEATGLRYDIIAAPNTLTKSEREKKFQISDYIKQIRRDYWPIFINEMEKYPLFQNVIYRHGGGLGHIHLFPDSRYREHSAEPHLNCFLNLKQSGEKAIGVSLRATRSGDPENDSRIDEIENRSIQRIEAKGLEPYSKSDFSSEEAMFDTAQKHIAIAAEWLEEVRAVFDPDFL